MIGETGLRRDTPLSRRIKEIIRRDGPMTIQTYMSHCLWDADYGYYRKQPIFGAAGDFITAADISQVFGELIGVWAGVVWQGVLGAPNPVTLVEYGPGRGTMMRDVLRAARIVPGFANVARVHLVEASDALAEIQSATLTDFRSMLSWGRELDEFNPPAIIFANEFINSWPVAQCIKTATGWHIRGVTVDASGELQFAAVDGDCPGEAFEALLPKAPPGTVIETQRLDQLAEALKALADRGPMAFLMIDYGHTTPAAGDTLQAVRGHGYEFSADVSRRGRSHRARQFLRPRFDIAPCRPCPRRPRDSGGIFGLSRHRRASIAFDVRQPGAGQRNRNRRRPATGTERNGRPFQGARCPLPWLAVATRFRSRACNQRSAETVMRPA